MNPATDREAIPEPQNPLGVDGIEFIELATSRPQALGSALETLGFRPIARHRSREEMAERYYQPLMQAAMDLGASLLP